MVAVALGCRIVTGTGPHGKRLQSVRRAATPQPLSTRLRSPIMAYCARKKFSERLGCWPEAGRALAWAGILAWGLGGCVRPGPDSPSPSPVPPASNVPLRLLVVGDPAMAQAVEQLRNEWQAQAGTPLEVAHTGQLDLNAAQGPDAHVLIVSSALLPDLAVRQWIVPMPSPTGAGHDAEKAGDAPDVFPFLRAREVVWADATVAVPFGSAVLTLYYRADLLERLKLRPPRTWPEYTRIAALLADRSALAAAGVPATSPWYPTVEPLGPGWAGVVLMARAAPYVAHRANYSTFFHIDTMRPLVDGPPFVRPLEELIAAVGPNGQELLRFDPAQARHAFWSGHCGMAVTWPSATHPASAPSNPNLRAAIAELPGSSEVFNIGSRNWEPRTPGEDPHVALVGIAGRLGVVTSQCPAPDAGFRLLQWLSGEPWDRQVCPVSPETTLFRRSHMRSPQAWTEAQLPAAIATQYALLVQRAFTQQQWLFALRIPGRSEYLAALDQAVHEAVRGQQTPREALQNAAKRWQEITTRLGLDRQRDAYRRGLGL